MPQMAPALWVNLYISSVGVLLVVGVLLYYFMSPKVKSHEGLTMDSQLKMAWVW